MKNNEKRFLVNATRKKKVLSLNFETLQEIKEYAAKNSFIFGVDLQVIERGYFPSDVTKFFVWQPHNPKT